ncbi:ChbG/HpnK family deacetylase [Pseudorhodoplanes sp.]|uniref:ChbG/HpnK family deacetylase n=1 Tax=Pseudorhodoplanes sp. TaxID=1934341 RepID=UPI002C157B5C|nr:ChbG/HpnK family deacetylase [Pseudorhodoplanes sp.]HWV54940.1 ChbG/HpnK family deacetylase [Pseudorhodoplanes sp.]
MTPAGTRRIVLCADDYGISPGVSEAIRDLIARGRLNATSAMVVAPSLTASEAASLTRLKRDLPHLQIGLHFTLTAPFRPVSEGFSPLKQDSFLPLTTTLGSALIARLDRERIAQELRSQLAAFSERFGFLPDYVDGHQHVQIFPQIRDAILAVMRDAMPGAWVRQCGRATPLAARIADRKGLLLDTLSRGFRSRAAAMGVAYNPAFAGSYDFGSDPDFAALFPKFLDALPAGSVVMCHPGFVDDELRTLDPLTDLREREFAFLGSDAFPELLRKHRVTLS